MSKALKARIGNDPLALCEVSLTKMYVTVVKLLCVRNSVYKSWGSPEDSRFMNLLRCE